MTFPARTKVGIISFAHPHAEAYATILASRPDVDLRVTDPPPHAQGEVRGARLAERLQVEYLESTDQLLSWRPDAVIVASENSRHRVHTQLAASAGAHVLCEKPLATSRLDGEAMIAACERAGVWLMVAYPVRFSPSVRQLVDIYREGTLGEIVAVRASNAGKLPLDRAWFTDFTLSGGGALIDHVVHVADVIDVVLERPAKSVAARANSVLHPEYTAIETGGLVLIDYGQGTIASIDASWSVPSAAPTWGSVLLDVVGTRAAVTIDVFGGNAIRGVDEPSGLSRELPFGPDPNEIMLSHFLTSVRTGTPPQPDGSAGLRSLDVALGALQSASTAERIHIPDHGHTTLTNQNNEGDAPTRA